ncbi:MAG: hypothetical protein ABI467_06695 [Kofleriaceae bacterium]
MLRVLTTLTCGLTCSAMLVACVAVDPIHPEFPPPERGRAPCTYAPIVVDAAAAVASGAGLAVLETSSQGAAIKDAGGALFTLGTVVFLGAAIWGAVQHAACEHADQYCFASATGLECTDSRVECERRRDELSATAACIAR